MNIANIKQCTNCGACLSSCPTGAISIDKEGLFYKPTIALHNCKDCGACFAVCPIGTKREGYTPKACFCAQHQDRQIRLSSSSGGAFSALAEYVCENGGIVFGATFGQNHTEVIFSDTDHVELDELRRSKYVESLVGDSFLKVRQQLENGRIVLFCGTPCQTAGLLLFLKKEYPNLIACDFICGGLPSHKLFQEYLTHFTSNRKTIAAINFRSKYRGWTDHYIRISFLHGKDYVRHFSLDPFFSAFLRGKCSVRENCLDCPFSDKHFSDLTIADYWNWRDDPEIHNDDTGLSLVIANTDKAMALLRKTELRLSLRRLKDEMLQKVIRKNAISDEDRARRTLFLKEAEKLGLFESARNYTEYRGIKKAKQMMKEILYSLHIL